MWNKDISIDASISHWDALHFLKYIEKLDLNLTRLLLKKLWFEWKLNEKHIILKKKQFYENINNEIIRSIEKIRIDYFLFTVDKALFHFN